MLARSRLAAYVGLVLLPLAFAQLIRADCYTLDYGGVNGNPNDNGAYGTWYSTTYRLNGNEVYSYSTTGVYGPNAGLIITWVATYLHLNGNLINSYTAHQSTYGATIQADTWWYLHDASGYWLGTYQLGNPNGYRNDHWGTSPYCQALGYLVDPIHYYDWGNTYTAVKPTITGPDGSSRAAFWYLGGAPSIDGYYVTTLLTGNSNWGSSPPMYWTVIQNPAKVSLNASVANQVVVTSKAPSAGGGGQYQYDVLVQADTDGLPTDPFPLNINAPMRAYGYLSSQGSYDHSGTGYESDYSYILYDTANNPMTVPITLHETLENCKQYSSSNWCAFGLHPGTWTPSLWAGGQFVDKYTAQINQGLSPAPMIPQQPLGTTKVLDLTQKFFIGAAGDPQKKANVFAGQCVQRNRAQSFRDHGLLDSVTSPIAADDCKAGQFVN